jgi:hypothetical protein
MSTFITLFGALYVKLVDAKLVTLRSAKLRGAARHPFKLKKQFVRMLARVAQNPRPVSEKLVAM